MLQKALKNIAKVTLTFATVLLLSSNTASASHKNYYIRATVDYSGFGIMSEVITDDAQGKTTGLGAVVEKTSPYAEEKGGYSYAKVKHYGNVVTGRYSESGDHLRVNFLKNRDDVENLHWIYKLLQDTSQDGLVFSFPGLKGAMNGGYKATSNDFTRATMVSDTLTTGLNQALLFIKNNSNQNIVSNHSLHLALAKLSYVNDIEKVGSYTITIGGKGSSARFKLEEVRNITAKVQDELIPVSGLRYTDYVKITALDGPNGKTYSYFPWRMEKGYHPGQPLHEYVTPEYRKNVKEHENEYLTWGQLILQAMLNTDIFGKTEQDFAGDAQTIIGQGLGSDLSRTVSSMRNMLGLAPMSELVLNMGARPANYHMGVMSHTIQNISMTIYTLNLIIALLFVGFMVVKMIHQHMVSTTNVIARTSLMEGIKDVIFVAVMLGFFAPLFEILLELNYLIVRTFSYSSEYMSAFSILGSKALSMESMAGFMVSMMFLSVDMYINFVYLVRELVVAFLYAIAPLVIISYLWSQTQKNMVFNFFRELIGNIFMQSFHAITMTFFSGYNLTNMGTLQALVSAYCFVPITQLFRQLVIGNSGGVSEKLGGKLAGQVATTVTGMQKSGMAYKHAKQMQETQAQASLDKQKWSTGGQVISSVATVAGMAGGPVGMAIGAGIGAAVQGIGNMIGEANMHKEIGKTMNEQGKEQLGMGLAELGLGLGVSSFDDMGGRMVGSGLQTMQRGAEMKGKADALYNPNNAFGLGDATWDLAKASGIKGAGDGLSKGIQMVGHEMIHRNAMSTDTKKDMASVDSLAGLNEVKANHVHSVENINKTTGEMTINTRITEQDLQLPEFRGLNEAYNAYRNRNESKQAMADWQKMSNETGIKEFTKDLEDRLKFVYDSRRSGFTGKFETEVVGDNKHKFFVTDQAQVRRKVD